MKNYQNSDYAANKNAKGIVYRFADQTIEVTLGDYLRENPDKTEADFAKLKALSDSDYYEQDRDDYCRTWKNVPLSGLDETRLCSTPSAEIEIVGRDEQAERKRKRQEVALAAIGKLTDVQRRRYLMYHAQGMTVREIAAEEGVAFQVMGRSISGATKKIKKFLASTQKMG